MNPYEATPPASPTTIVSFAEAASPTQPELSQQSRPSGCSKLSVPQVKLRASSLLSAAAASGSDNGDDAVWLGGDTRQASDIILRLHWKLRVHAYLSKFVAACGAVTFALEVLSGFLTPLGGRQDRQLAAALRSTHSGEWIGCILICAGAANVWVKNGRVSLLVAFGASLLGAGFAALGSAISCLLLAIYFQLRDPGATQDLLNAALLALFVLLAQLCGLLALLAHTVSYHPYRVFRVANRLRADSAATAETALTAGLAGSEDDQELREQLTETA